MRQSRRNVELIQSAATFCKWKDARVIIIDAPGYADLTIEAERASCALDGAVVISCGASGAQSQNLTVGRQMKRRSASCLAFANKLDRQGSNPCKVIGNLRSQLKSNAAAAQVPIGLEDKHAGMRDSFENKGCVF